MTSHCYRKPGYPYTTPVRNKSGTRWLAQGYAPGQGTTSLGTFDSPERANLATRLYKHWLSKGCAPGDIPRSPQTREAV
ncbi:MAG: hypothetical protein G3W58_22910 [Pantoea ananatis]|nr:hypothetical protein [Pantoea ananatis]